MEGRLRRAPAAIVSSLPLLLKPESLRLALLAQAMDAMTADGRFIQFTYSPLPPIPRDKVIELDLKVEASSPVWLNLPPARVWVYRRFTQADFGLIRKRPNPAQELIERLRLGSEKVHLELVKEFSAAKERLRAGNPKPSRKGGFWGDPDFKFLADPYRPERRPLSCRL